jgi:hypothetical protein
MNEKAIENYTRFLKVWGKVDPLYKEPADARARLARLKRGEGLFSEVMIEHTGNLRRTNSSHGLVLLIDHDTCGKDFPNE